MEIASSGADGLVRFLEDEEQRSRIDYCSLRDTTQQILSPRINSKKISPTLLLPLSLSLANSIVGWSTGQGGMGGRAWHVDDVNSLAGISPTSIRFVILSNTFRPYKCSPAIALQFAAELPLSRRKPAGGRRRPGNSESCSPAAAPTGEGSGRETRRRWPCRGLTRAPPSMPTGRCRRKWSME